MYTEIIQKLFMGRDSGKQLCIYNRRVEAVAKTFELRSQNFIHAALNDLRNHFQHIHLGPTGRILNARQMGRHFAALYRIISQNVDLFVLYKESQLHSPLLPLSRSFRDEFRKIILAGEAAALLLVTHPPEEAAQEIRRVSDRRLYGLMSLWASKDFREKTDIRDSVRDYLHHATVRVLTTGYDPEVNKICQSLNSHLEKHGGFEDSQWLRTVKSVVRDDKKKSLKQAFAVCIPIIVVIKFVERFLPGMLHAVGGVLDDLFGAIIPDVSQSMGDPDQPMEERFKKAWPILRGGLITLPLAFGLGWLSAYLYGTSQSVAIHILAGVLFALACCAGTLGTSAAAILKAYNAIGQLEKDKTNGHLVARLSTEEKMKLAFRESIMDVPFRVGHTLIGVPFQIALGIAAGAFGFFHSSIFIMVEGMAETLFGAAATFLNPYFSRFGRNQRLRQTKLQ